MVNRVLNVLYYCLTREDALMWEKYIVDSWFIARKDTYNINLGGNCSKIGRTLSAEHRRKIGEANKGKMLGHKQSEETKQKRNSKLKGRKLAPFTEDHLQKLSLAKLGKPSPHRGKTLSEETKQKISEARKGKPWSEARKLAQEARKHGK
jgi:hypothetical protein